jgi:hypothetical protein
MDCPVPRIQGIQSIGDLRFMGELEFPYALRTVIGTPKYEKCRNASKP